MTEFVEVPSFTKGEPGFAAKLNQLGDAVRQLQGAVDGLIGDITSAVGAPIEFDPSEHDVDEVNDYLATAALDEYDRVLQAEKAGKARKGVLSR